MFDTEVTLFRFLKNAFDATVADIPDDRILNVRRVVVIRQRGFWGILPSAENWARNCVGAICCTRGGWSCLARVPVMTSPPATIPSVSFLK